MTTGDTRGTGLTVDWHDDRRSQLLDTRGTATGETYNCFQELPLRVVCTAHPGLLPCEADIMFYHLSGLLP